MFARLALDTEVEGVLRKRAYQYLTTVCGEKDKSIMGPSRKRRFAEYDVDDFDLQFLEEILKSGAEEAAERAG